MNAYVDWRRWGTAFMVVLLAHAGLGLGLMPWQIPLEPQMPPPGAVLIELAPLPQAPPAQTAALPVGPEQEETEPLPPPQPVVEKIPDLKPPPPQVKPVAVLPKKPAVKPVKPTPPPEVVKQEPSEKPPVKETTAPPGAPVVPSANVAAAAPAPQAVQPPSDAVPNWQGLILARLEREKKYPRAARMRRQEGVVQLRFRLDRDGNVLSYAIARSAGFALLDQEVLAMIQRAKRLPPPPPEIAQSPLELIVPVQFFLR